MLSKKTELVDSSVTPVGKSQSFVFLPYLFNSFFTNQDDNSNSPNPCKLSTVTPPCRLMYMYRLCVLLQPLYLNQQCSYFDHQLQYPDKVQWCPPSDTSLGVIYFPPHMHLSGFPFDSFMSLSKVLTHRSVFGYLLSKFFVV